MGLINKYYDLAKAGDELAKDHYRKLEKTTVSAAVIVKDDVHSMLVRSAAWMRSQITSTNNYSQKQSITV